MELAKKISRNEAAAILDVTPRMVIVLQEQGRLPPPEREDGRVYYDAEAVAELKKVYTPNPVAKNRRGDPLHSVKHMRVTAASRVFECFKQGMTNIADIVLATKVEPITVRRLWREYTTPVCEEEEREKVREEKRLEREKKKKEGRDEYWRRRERVALINSNKLDDMTIRRLAREL